MTEVAIDPAFRAYLLTNRAFLAPAVEAAVEALELPQGGHVLDAGTGAGGALAPLVKAVGTNGSVTAVDLSLAVLKIAEEQAKRTGVSEQVNLVAGDLNELLAQCPGGEQPYDAIWASDLLWPGNFDDPPAVARSLAQSVVPGGTVALFYSNYYRATFMPGYSRLEHLLHTASELRWDMPAAGPHHYERHVNWLLDAGLRDVQLRVFPRVGLVDDREDHELRAYLERTVWPELLESARTHGHTAGMTEPDLAWAERLLTPGSGEYVLDEPGYYCVHPAVLVTGTR